jgi:hypothetical protein
MSLIADTLQQHLPGKRKHTPSGWISFNAVCCDDKRQRGGFIVNAGDAVSYHCFNCGFKCSWQPGRHISKNMNKFMRDLNIPDDVISQLRLEALRLDDNNTTEIRSIIPKFEKRALPIDAISFEELTTFLKLPDGDYAVPTKFAESVAYLVERKIDPFSYPFYWTNKVGFNNRIIIPFLYKGEIVGWTARAITDAKPKYLSEQQPGYVFNLDNQQDEREFVIVSEGPFDALSIDGCALLGAEIKDSQNWLLKQLGKELILVPDKDHEGPRTVEQAIELGWSVSMPDWPSDVKDVNDAVVKIGKLATLWLIVQAKESNALKIRLRAKQWFKDQQYE